MAQNNLKIKPMVSKLLEKTGECNTVSTMYKKCCSRFHTDVHKYEMAKFEYYVQFKTGLSFFVYFTDSI